MSAGLCQVLDGLAAAQLEVLRRINRKFLALQRMTQLLEQLGDFTVIFPNLSQLIPIGAIDISTYESLRSACQFLNLPPAPPDDPGTAIVALKRTVTDAYAVLLRQLSNHPHFRLGKVQKLLTKAQGDINMGFAIAGDYLRCAQAACHTVGAVGSTLEKVASADIGKEVQSFQRNFVENSGEVLSAGAKIKYTQVQDTIIKLKELSADTAEDVTTSL